MSRVVPAPRKNLSLREVFARNTRLFRIHLGISQEALADAAGLDRTFVSSLERGVRNISIDNIELICAALDTPAHELLAPDFPSLRGLDEAAIRAPRTARPYPSR